MGNIRLRDQKLLWMKSGELCAYSGCRRRLAIEVEQSGRRSIVSQEAHIVAEKPDGPRGQSPLTLEERNSYPNLLLLCLEHHKIVDDDPETFTVDRLLRMKTEHEAWFDSLRGPDDHRHETSKLLMIDIIDEWEERADLDNWQSWVSAFLGYSLRVTDETMDRLQDLDMWLYSRAWPDAYPALPPAFENLRGVATTLRTAAECALTPLERAPVQRYVPDHKQRILTQERYKESLAEAEWVRDLFADLAFELTRAANWILDEVRLAVDPRYKADLGVLMVERGENLGFRFHRPRYRPVEVAGEKLPFHNFRQFLSDRSERDIRIGQGINEGGYRCVTPFDFGGA